MHYGAVQGQLEAAGGDTKVGTGRGAGPTTATNGGIRVRPSANMYRQVRQQSMAPEQKIGFPAFTQKKWGLSSRQAEGAKGDQLVVLAHPSTALTLMLARHITAKFLPGTPPPLLHPLQSLCCIPHIGVGSWLQGLEQAGEKAATNPSTLCNETSLLRVYHKETTSENAMLVQLCHMHSCRCLAQCVHKRLAHHSHWSRAIPSWALPRALHLHEMTSCALGLRLSHRTCRG